MRYDSKSMPKGAAPGASSRPDGERYNIDKTLQNQSGEDTMSMTGEAAAGTVDNVVARIERLPTSWWHVRTRIIVGVATFFDAFDALAIAAVLPARCRCGS